MSGSTGGNGTAFTGISPPRASEDLAERVVRILREFRRPVPFDMLARIADEPENVVRPVVRRLEAEHLVRWQGSDLVLT